MGKKPISRKRVVWNYFVTLLVLLSLLSQFSTSSAVQAAGSDPKINANRLEPAADSTNCHPGTGWKWSYGGFLPDVALEAQKELELQGLQTTVKARSFGEVDDCGTFRQSAVDFDINFPTE